MKGYRITRCKEQRLSDWVTLVSRTIESDHFQGAREYHSLKQADYVCVLAITDGGKVPLVRQYRPALQNYTLELPGGLMDPGEAAEKSALRELKEETGYVAETAVFLGKLCPDVGRLENKMWAYFVPNAIAPPSSNWQAERDVELILLDMDTFYRALLSGDLCHALHVAVVGLALLRGLLNLGPLIANNQANKVSG